MINIIITCTYIVFLAIQILPKNIFLVHLPILKNIVITGHFIYSISILQC